jgi:hypothetical protein
MRNKRLFWWLLNPCLLTCCALSLGAVMAHAEAVSDHVQQGLTLAEQVYNADDPIQARSALTVEEQNLLDSVTQPATVEVESQLIEGAANLDAFTGCWGWHQVYGRKALAGNTLYTYWQTTRVCAQNGRVTSVAVTYADGETSTPGWRIAHAPTTSTRNVGWEGRGLARYYFVLGAGPWDIVHPSDCIQQRLNGNGHDHRSMSSCDLAAP